MDWSEVSLLQLLLFLNTDSMTRNICAKNFANAQCAHKRRDILAAVCKPKPKEKHLTQIITITFKLWGIHNYHS